MPRHYRLEPSHEALVLSLEHQHQAAIRTMLGRIQATLNALQDDRNAAPTEPVYHYSNRHGLDGILKSGVFWLTDYTEMFDTSEIQYGLGIGLETLRQEYDKSAGTGRLKAFKRAVENAATRGLPRRLFKGYILSLTPKADELTQWEIYGSRARGYAMGFSGRLLDKAFTAFKTRNGIKAAGSFKVLYDERRLRRLMRQHVKNTLQGILFLRERTGRDQMSARRAMGEAAVNLLFAFIFTALFFKHPAYKHEDEYRFFVMTLPDRPIAGLKNRVGRRGRRVSYYEFDWKRRYGHALRTLRIGPAQDEARGRTVARRALRRGQLTARIFMSDIPRIDR